MPYYLNQKKHAIAGWADRLLQLAYTPVADLRITAWMTAEPVPYANRETGTEAELKAGDAWGGLFDCAWMRFRGQVPSEAAGKQVVLLIDVNGEALLVDEAGEPTQGLTCVSSMYDYSLGRPGKRVVPVSAKAVGGEAIDLWADCGNNDLFGNFVGNGCIKEACVAIEHPQVLALAYDWEVLYDLMTLLPEDSARRAKIMAALCKAERMLGKVNDETAAQARAVLAPELAKRNGDASLKISAIGHAHIDLAWLWPIRETIRKGARTFATTLQLMEKYPDYVFGESQPQLFQWMKEYYPGLYARIAERVREGRLEAQGAMWVEADANVPSGESFVRQVLLGKRFFRAEFGVDPKVLWLPDVFGYSGALPQILKKAGVDYFMTQKLSWSIVNTYPHQTFLWQGIDGSQVLAHLPPEDTYNSSGAPHALLKAERNFHDKMVSDECLVLFGIGDGGGGPGEEHVERLLRQKDLNGVPPTTQEPAEKFFARLESVRADLHTWVGELYLERHQGTYTTQARNKRYNRKMELGLREAEWMSVLATAAGVGEYPSERLDTIWKEMLLYQFHDILPGSSITRVYTESLERYAALLAEVKQLTETATKAFVGVVNTAGAARPLVVSNSLSFPRTEWIQHDGKWLKPTVPSMGYTVVDLAAAAPEAPELHASAEVLENDLLHVVFDNDGSLISVFDKELGRESLAAGSRGNVLAVYEDDGDAWDFRMDYDENEPERFALVSAEPYVDGPIAGVLQTYRYGSSTLVQDVRVTAGSRKVEFITHAEWWENARMLRSSFPTSVNSNEATFEIQFGSLKRPTHNNTSWNLGQFEVCAHRWVDISERGFGVALLNDCKYGYKVKGQTLDINLLRSPHSPDPVADRAEHDFTYALYVHAGDHVEGRVREEAHALNVPLRASAVTPSGGLLPATVSLLSCNAPNIVIDAVKKAEDGDAAIVRLYEADGKACCAKVQFAVSPVSAAVVDLMEENPVDLPVVDGAVTLSFKPFEIQTISVRL